MKRAPSLIVSFTLMMFFIVPLAMADRGLQVGENKNALVIGNADYQVGQLANPTNDARDMSGMLKQSGFSVDLLLNADQRSMEKAIRVFGRRLRDGGIGLFYYAGHGMQVKGVNFLIPIGANIGEEAEIKYESVDANRVLAMMESAGNRLNMMFLDACRDNPFSRSFRSSSRGLAQMDAPRGTLVSFATAPGKTAADGDGRNGLFTSHLLKHMSNPGVELGQLMKLVTRDVVKDSGGKQTPWRLSSTTGDFYFKGSAPAQKQPIQVAGGSVQQEQPGSRSGNLKVNSTPSGAKIYINDAFEGNGPLSISLDPGRYRVEARMKGFSTEHETIRLRSGKTLRLNLILDRIAASLWIRSQPEDARIYIDNEYYGVTPDTIRDLSAGSVRVRVFKKGFEEWERTVNLVKGEEKELNVALVKRNPYPDMVFFPAGQFEMGHANGDDSEDDVHTVILDEYFIDKYEVTVGQYRKCVDSGRCKEHTTMYWDGKDSGQSPYCNWTNAGREDHPINCIDWESADSYCRWAGKRLPTEAEWERASSWYNGRKYIYPSGKSTIDCTDAVMDDGNKYGGSDPDGCGKDRTWPVGRKPAEINGTYDMAGNLWEWVADRWGYYSGSTQTNPRGPSSGTSHVMRGGSWITDSGMTYSYTRSGVEAINRGNHLGFRCAASP